MQAEVMLEDYNWYPCTIIAKSAALDYDGDRIHVVLDENITVKPEGKKPYALKAGFRFLDCHRDCIHEWTPLNSAPPTR